MLKRSDGKFLLTREIYELSRVIPSLYGKAFFDGNSNLYISFHDHEGARYYLSGILEGDGDIMLGFVDEMTLEEAREKVSQHFKMNNDNPVSDKEEQ